MGLRGLLCVSIALFGAAVAMGLESAAYEQTMPRTSWSTQALMMSTYDHGICASSLNQLTRSLLLSSCCLFAYRGGRSVMVVAGFI